LGLPGETSKHPTLWPLDRRVAVARPKDGRPDRRPMAPRQDGL